MHEFVKLIETLDSTTSTNEKVDAISNYFINTAPENAVWALFFLSGHRLKRLVSTQKLRTWCLEETNIPEWLFMESYAHVGDTAELIALLFQHNANNVEERNFSKWMEEVILPLRTMNEQEQRKIIVDSWKNQTTFERFITNKILTGAFRIGVSALLTLQGLSKAFNIPLPVLSLRLAGEWKPTETFFRQLVAQEGQDEDVGSLKPYPFFLASHVQDLKTLGDPSEWLAEWKWDGIRAQVICYKGNWAIWSRGNELITKSFPDLLRDDVVETDSFVLDGEILAYENDRPRPFGDLQKRLGRKEASVSIQKKYPVVFMIYDLLQWKSKDLREMFFIERRKLIDEHKQFFLSKPQWKISPVLSFDTWESVKKLQDEAYKNSTEGLILKKKNSKYGIGRRRGSWWKFKIESMTIDAVLLYAQPGSGYRSGLYTDYTFGIWEKGELIPIAKAYSGLTNEEIKELDKWIRKNTLEKFGPVRKVKAEIVFELAFEGIQISKRHKAGLALRFPRIKRWRKDKPSDQADNLESVRELLKQRLQ